jgi:hypothetical protein
MSCNSLARTRLVPASLLVLVCFGWATACAGSGLPEPTLEMSDSQAAVCPQGVIPASLEQVRANEIESATRTSAVRPGHMIAIKGAALGFLLATFMLLAAMFLGVRVAWPSRDSDASENESRPPADSAGIRSADGRDDDRDDEEAPLRKRRPRRRRVHATIPLRTVRRVEVRPALCEQYAVYSDEYEIDEELAEYDELRPRVPLRVVRQRKRPRRARRTPPEQGRTVAARPKRGRRKEVGREEVVAMKNEAMRGDAAVADSSGAADWDTENQEVAVRPVRGDRPQVTQPPTVRGSTNKPVMRAPGASIVSSSEPVSSASGSVFQQIVRENLRLREGT